MIFKKLASVIAVGLSVLIVGAPVTGQAATNTNTKNKIKTLTKQLNFLPNKMSAYSRVANYVNKLSKLDPKKAAFYYKKGLSKLAPGPKQEQYAKQMANTVNKNVKNSDLPASQIKKITSTVSKEESKYPPYQAYMPTLEFAPVA